MTQENNYKRYCDGCHRVMPMNTGKVKKSPDGLRYKFYCKKCVEDKG